MSGCPVPQRQGERVHEGGQRWGSWSPAAELKASPPLVRPQNGSIILYNRKKVKYRKDGYLWKKRKDGKTTREDHMKLKVQGMEGLNRGRVGEQTSPPPTPACLLAVSVWLLRSLFHRPHIPSALLLAAAES